MFSSPYSHIPIYHSSHCNYSHLPHYMGCLNLYRKSDMGLQNLAIR